MTLKCESFVIENHMNLFKKKGKRKNFFLHNSL